MYYCFVNTLLTELRTKSWYEGKGFFGNMASSDIWEIN